MIRNHDLPVMTGECFIIALLKKWFRPKNPHIVPSESHGFKLIDVSTQAQHVLKTLNASGFEAYLVGGCVRDLLLGRHPKDFDIATSAHPEQVRHLFRNCRLIGRRFRLAHVFFGRNIIEVATFRKGNTNDDDQEAHRKSQHGMILRDNVYGSLEEDAWRRDFTVNALYYNAVDGTIIDYTNGLKDLHARRLSMLGDPLERYREDPVRMLRALRFAGKLGFTLAPKTATPIRTLRELLKNVPPARLFEEISKIFLSGRSENIFPLMEEYHLFEYLFPATQAHIKTAPPTAKTFLYLAFHNTDQRLQHNKSINPAFLWAALLWHPLCDTQRTLVQKGLRPLSALHLASQEVVKAQQPHTAITKRITLMIREIWLLQWRITHIQPHRVEQYLTHARFRAAYDFLLLRVHSGEAPELSVYADWWTRYQSETQADARRKLLEQCPTAHKEAGTHSIHHRRRHRKTHRPEQSAC